ncbi:MAG: glutamate--tRNA ligase [Planctomycetales bacterium]|nr:glutamate--tRNA ligase [Planctomycetales bacterium]
MTVRTRFAPSPTGYLHIGGVRTALFNWLFARKHGGQFILRIDDTDQQRNIEAALEPILEGFRWLGLDWDEGPEVGGPHAPYYQSQRSEQHQAAAKRLLEAGFAYRDYATAEEVQAEREAAEKEKRDFVYSRRWMAETDEQAAAYEAEGRSFVVRLKMPREGNCEFRDLVRGDVSFDWAKEQDHVIQRGDGTCLYHLASVVDDADLEISHVIRAIEHLPNTSRQIFIAQSLGYKLPEYAHLPYVAEPGGTAKISKRKLDKYLKNRDFKSLCDHGMAIAAKIGHATSADTFNPVIVDFYREVGYLPDAILNYLLLLGWSLDDKTEEFTRDEMIQHFTLERVNSSPASFDPQKLSAFQLRHMQQLPIKQKVALVLPYLQKAGFVASPPPCDTAPLLTKIVKAAGDRIKTAGDILEFDEFFVADADLVFEEKAFEKRVRKDGAADLLRAFREALANTEPFDHASCEATLRSFIESQDIKIGDIIHALRVAVTGKGVGVGMFEALEILGKERCLARIDRTLGMV